MRKKDWQNDFSGLPQTAAEYIRLVVRKMRYRRKVRGDVEAELIAHFEDALRDVKDMPEREKRAGELIEQFGDAKMLAKLIRRGKKRCRPLWQKVVMRTAAVLGILILYVGLRIGFMFVGKPGSSVHYVAVLNESVRAGRSEELNSQPLYTEATNVYKEYPKDINYRTIGKWPGDLSDVERREVFKWV